MSGQRLWYTRRGQIIRGPFPSGLISRYLLLGRIVDSDEVSTDQIHWRLVSEHPSLYPSELKSDLTDPGNRQRLEMARMREDERRRDRRDEERHDMGPDGRVYDPNDRRAPEDEDILQRRDTRNRVAEAFTSPGMQQQRRLVGGIIIAFLLVMLIAFLITPEQDEYTFHCLQEPVVGVNWNGCKKNAEDLRQLNLEHSNLANAYFNDSIMIETNLSYSLLEYSQFLRANLSTANLSYAQMKGSVLQSAMLRDVNMYRAKMSWSIFRDANMQGAILIEADLSNADLRGALLEDANLSGAVLDHAIWIDGSRCAEGSVGKCIPVQPVTDPEQDKADPDAADQNS